MIWAVLLSLACATQEAPFEGNDIFVVREGGLIAPPYENEFVMYGVFPKLDGCVPLWPAEPFAAQGTSVYWRLRYRCDGTMWGAYGPRNEQ